MICFPISAPAITGQELFNHLNPILKNFINNNFLKLIALFKKTNTSMTVFNHKLLYFLAVLFFTLCLNGQLMSQGCPFGIENCRGGCGRWIDEDGDGFCDLSIINTTDTLVAKDSVKINVGDNKLNTPKTTDQNPASNQKIKLTENTISENHNNTIQPENEAVSEAINAEQISSKKRRPRYNLILYSSLTLGAYLLSLLLMKRNIYSKKTHRRIWNILLLLTFLISGLLGLLLVVQINYGILLKHFRQFMQWHVDFGIAMSLISVFHIIWHFSYFKNIFRKNNYKTE